MKRMFGVAVIMMAVCLPGYGQQATAAESKTTASAAQSLGHDQQFRLAFVVRETDEKGKVLNSREYDAMVGANAHSSDSVVSIRTGARVPVSSGPGNSPQFTYMDVGVNFDVIHFVALSSNRVAMNVQAEVSSFDSTPDQGKTPPVVRQNKWHGDEQMVLGERRVIFSSDDLTSKNKVQVELMVTRVE